MLLGFFILLAWVLLLTQCNTKKQDLVMPAEWESQDAVLLTYTEDPGDSLTSLAVRATCDELIKIIAARMKIYVLVNQDWNKDSLRMLF
jgi:agmatine/peptidylarginine deiminase